MERALQIRGVVGAIDAVDPLAERPVDLELIGVLMQVHLLVRMAAVVVRRMSPAITTIGMESSAALATPVAALVSPDRDATARPVSRSRA